MTPYCARKYFGGTGSAINLWKLFKFNELNMNMRQKNDRVFAELLGRLRLNRLTDEDLEILNSRVINTDRVAERFVEMRRHDEFTMALFPLVEEVDAFNKKVRDNW